MACEEQAPVATPIFVATPEQAEQVPFLDDTPVPEEGYPVVSAESSEDGYPSPAVQTGSLDGRSQSAFTSYEQAVAIAREEFHPEAYLASIMPSQLMLRNLGNPPVLPGWFFNFRKPDSRREFLIQFVDGVPTGSTLTEAMLPPGKTPQPIDVTALAFDSPTMLEQFELFARDNGLWRESYVWDYELINFVGGANAVWSVYDPATGSVVYSMDANTGQQVANPHE